MQWQISKQRWKYLRIELGFFIAMYVLFPVLTDIEFNYRETHHTALFVKNIENRIAYGTFSLLAFVCFYKLVQQFLFSRKLLLFLTSLFCFLACYHFYSKGVDLAISKTPFLSAELRNEALVSYNRDTGLRFGINYMILQLLCVIALAYFVRSARQDEQVQRLKEEQLMSELNYLKAQLHPHFFFNTLNNIYSLALKQSPDTAPVVAKLADMMQYILYEADQTVVPLSRDIAFLSNYVQVEQIRYNSSATISFDIQLDGKETYIQPLLLLPFIENAFKHGLEEETDEGFIRIVICRDEEELILEVANSKPSTLQLNKGMGLKNVYKRLNLLYPGRHRLAVTENETFYQVNLTLQNI